MCKLNGKKQINSYVKFFIYLIISFISINIFILWLGSSLRINEIDSRSVLPVLGPVTHFTNLID